MRNNLGPGLWREKSKNWKMRHKHSMRWKWQETLKKGTNEKCTLDCGEKTAKTGK